jgi:hypothetical protein
MNDQTPRLRQLKRFEELKHRKNFLPSLVITAGFWLLLGWFVYFIDPDTTFAIPIFFILLFISLLFTFAILFVNTRRGFLAGLAFSTFAVLRYFGVGSLLNFFLIVGVAIALDYYLRQ